MTTNIKLYRLVLLGILLTLASQGCKTTGIPASRDASTPIRIDRVFFAQHHVMEPENPLFRLTGNLEALIKVQVYADRPVQSPYVFAILELEGRKREMRLQGPRVLPRKLDVDPVLMEQSYDDSFTAIIPADWIKTGLKVTVEARDYDYSRVGDDDLIYTNNAPGHYISVLDRRDIPPISIGAPTRLTMQFFDIHYFGRGTGADFPDGWETELKSRLPVSELTIHRVKNILFKEIVMPPQGNSPPHLYRSTEEYEARTGKPFDGEQAIALRWCAALKAAGGTYGLWRPYEVTIAGVHSGGQAGGYRSCANLHRHGVLLHELGHTFGLPHWMTNKDYPYKRTMYGEDQGEPTIPNAGPTWAFDLHRREFLAPRAIIDGKLDWKRDPMHGGGWSREKDYLYRYFSDYSIFRIRKRLEEQAVYWDKDIGQYAKWNQDSGAYDIVVENDGVQLPLERDVDVISVIACPNLAVPDANIIYPPIGPYKAGLIRLFNANSQKDREEAANLGYTPESCNVALRVTQGGKVTPYILRAKISPDDDPMRAFPVAAINLPARDGDVTQVELLYCKDLIPNGLTPEHKILYTWEAHPTASPP